MAVELEELVVRDTKAFRAWLARYHDRSPGVWLVLHKRGGNVTSLTYDQALDEALSFGWIDGQVARRDEASYRQRFTPRRPKSLWSARNVGIIERLEREGRMTPAGRAAVEAAKADGRWANAYASPADATIPADLAKAIEANARARKTFATLNAANRFALFYRVNSVKRPETRERKIRELVAMLARGETPHPQKPRT